MTLAEKLTEVANNRPKLYNKGALDYSPQETVSGEAIGITDISPIEHNMGVSVRSKNLLPFPYQQSTTTLNGITFTDNGDGTITTNGTAEETATLVIKQHIKLTKGKSYVWSGCPLGGSSESYGLFFQDETFFKQGVQGYGEAKLFIAEYEDYYCWIRIIKGTTVNNLVFKPMIEEGTTATSYAPYIEDISTVKLYKQCKNWLSVGLVRGNFSTSGLNNVNKSVVSSYGFYLKVGTYTVSGVDSNYRLYVNGMSAIDKKSDYQEVLSTKRTFTIPTDGLYNIQFNRTDGIEFDTTEIENLKLLVELGTTPTEYEPYIEPTVYDVKADGTVEGVTSLYPNTTLYTDTSGAVIDCTYYQDGRKVKENLTDMILSLGGVINE